MINSFMTPKTFLIFFVNFISAISSDPAGLISCHPNANHKDPRQITESKI